MQTLAAILFCCGSELQFVRYCTGRIMGVFQEALVKQLEMNVAFLTQMTLAVLVQCYRLNKCLPDEVSNHILRFGLSEKSMIFKVDSSNSNVGVVETRPILSTLVFLILDNQSDPTLAIKLIMDDKGFKNLFRDLSQESNRSVRILLDGLLNALEHTRIVKDFISKVISRMVLGKISDLSFSQNEYKSKLADSFLLAMSNFLISAVADSLSMNKSTQRYFANCTNDLLDALKPVKNETHKQVC
jgi:hypothetical protein